MRLEQNGKKGVWIRWESNTPPPHPEPRRSRVSKDRRPWFDTRLTARLTMRAYNPSVQNNRDLSTLTRTDPTTTPTTGFNHLNPAFIHPILALKLRSYAPESIAFTAPLALAKSICPA